MKAPILLFLLAILVSPIISVLADDDVEKGEYEFVRREQLARYIKIELDNYGKYDNQSDFDNKYIGKKIKTVDELSIFYDQKDETDKPEGDKDNQPHIKKRLDKNKLYKFDTVYFRCVIPPKQKKAVSYLRALNKEETERKLVFIYATVTKKPIHLGEASSEGKEGHSVVLVVDKLERPADRYFKEIEDEYWEDEKEPR